MKYNILHITDLHLYDISNSSQEYLRKGYYKTYIGNLIDTLKSKNINIDFIIFTGDIIDRNKYQNFEHAKEILKYLYVELNINEKSIGVCIGNHDFDNKLNKENKLEEARKNYYSFAENYVNGYATIIKKDYYTISKFNENVAFISLDATYDSQTIPSKLSDENINQLIEDIQKAKINGYEIVIIASHYPLVHFPKYPFPDEEGWYDSHYWRSGSFLRIRIEEILTNVRKLWLFGDTHQPGAWTNNSSTYVMAGRFGTKIEGIEEDNIKYLSKINRQASVIKIEDNKIHIDIIQHFSLEHNESSLRGKWAIDKLETSKIELIRPIIIDADIEKKILRRIIQEKLYRFGRFSTNSTYDILGWIFINDLLNNHSLLTEIIYSCKNFIDDKILAIERETLIVGIDHWGSIIGSHLSILTNIKNFPLPSRGNQQNYSKSELLEQNKKLFEKKYNSIILIIDVVNTGKTIIETIEKLNNILKLESNCKFYCISVISDVEQKKNKELLNLNSFATFCGALRQPLVQKTFLPSIIMLERKEYFNE